MSCARRLHIHIACWNYIGKAILGTRSGERGMLSLQTWRAGKDTDLVADTDKAEDLGLLQRGILRPSSRGFPINGRFPLDTWCIDESGSWRDYALINRME